VRVKGTGEQVLRLSDSHHGPVVARSATTAYAIRSAYADVVDVNAVWLAFNTARDYRGVEAGLALLQVLPHNAMAADTAGNVYYQRAGRVPRRPAGYDWSQPVDGSTSTTEWRGLHPASDLLQVANPPQGYMQNCNVPPDAMMEGSPFTPDRTPAYLFADRTQAQAFGHARTSGWTNSRGARAVALLKAEPRMTVDRAMAIANDIRPFSAHHWVRVLVRAHATSGSLHAGDPAYAAGVRELQAWDCELRADSRPALKYAWWRTQLLADLGGQRLASLAARIDGLREPLGETYDAPVLSDDELRTVAASFARALARMRSELGTLDRAYGDVFRVGRGDRSWPVEGGMAERLGLTTLRSVSYGAPRSDDTRWGAGGQTSTILVVLTRPIHSWTMVPLGQSDRPDSAHYRDQAEKLFSLRQMKPSWWTPEGLSGHIESRTVLAAAGMAIQ